MKVPLEPGDRVIATEEMRRCFPKQRHLVGTVIRLGRSGFLVIKRDGIDRVDMWHEKYWKKLEEPT